MIDPLSSFNILVCRVFAIPIHFFARYFSDTILMEKQDTNLEICSYTRNLFELEIFIICVMSPE